jgi:hypothetical protein
MYIQYGFEKQDTRDSLIKKNCSILAISLMSTLGTFVVVKRILMYNTILLHRPLKAGCMIIMASATSIWNL